MIVLIFGLASLILLTDQISKAIVVDQMVEGETIPVLPGFFELTFVRNPGASFGLAGGMTWVFSILAFAIVVAIAIVARRIHSVRWAVMIGLLLGGTVGNLSDRLFRQPGFPNGMVVDFISTPWMMPAIYNVADICIVSSMILFGWFSILGLKLDGTREIAPAKPKKSAAKKST
jgi:signal peptidase II